MLSAISVSPFSQNALTESRSPVRAAARIFFGAGFEMAAEGGGADDLDGGRINCDLSGWKGRKGCGSYESSVTGGINPGGYADGADDEDRSVRRGGSAEAIAGGSLTRPPELGAGT